MSGVVSSESCAVAKVAWRITSAATRTTRKPCAHTNDVGTRKSTGAAARHDGFLTLVSRLALKERLTAGFRSIQKARLTEAGLQSVITTEEGLESERKAVVGQQVFRSGGWWVLLMGLLLLGLRRVGRGTKTARRSKYIGRGIGPMARSGSRWVAEHQLNRENAKRTDSVSASTVLREARE
jgi:hypothetical protein